MLDYYHHAARDGFDRVLGRYEVNSVDDAWETRPII